jgi:hypothetical protein
LFWGFGCRCKKVNIFSYLINAENKRARASVGKVFLMIKIGPGFMGSLVYSLIKLLTRVCPSGTRGLVYRVRPIKEVENYKDSKIDLEAKKEDSNPYSTRILVNSCPVAYIKPGRGAPRGTSYNLQSHRHRIS